jgi:hypothetical protein
MVHLDAARPAGIYQLFVFPTIAEAGTQSADG